MSLWATLSPPHAMCMVLTFISRRRLNLENFSMEGSLEGKERGGIHNGGEKEGKLRAEKAHKGTINGIHM